MPTGEESDAVAKNTKRPIWTPPVIAAGSVADGTDDQL